MLIFVVGTQRSSVSISVQTDEGLLHGSYEAEIDKIHDAYIIAVEDEAKRKLDLFTSGQDVHAVDMTIASNSISQESINITNSPSNKGRTQVVVECKVESTPLQLETSFNTTTASMPVEKKKKNSHDQLSPVRDPVISNGGSRGNSGEWLEMNGFSDQEINNKGKGQLRSKSNNRDSNVPIISDYLENGSVNMSEDFHSQRSGYNNHAQLSFDSRDTSFDYDDPGPHREMAIDVPENFVASVKSPPRYPPPQHGSPIKSTNSSPSKANNNEGKEDNIYATSSKQSFKAQQQYQPTPQELERLHKHQEELKVLANNNSSKPRVYIKDPVYIRPVYEDVQLSETAHFDKGFVDTKCELLGLTCPTLGELLGLTCPTIGELLGLSCPTLGELLGLTCPTLGEFLGLTCPTLGELLGLTCPTLGELLGLTCTTLGELLGLTCPTLGELLGLTCPTLGDLLGLTCPTLGELLGLTCPTLVFQLIEITSRSPPVKAVTEDVIELKEEIQLATERTHNPKAHELCHLLNKADLRNVLEAHDAIAQQALQTSEDVDLGEPLDSPLVQFGEDSVRIVHLEKTTEHLGATVKNEGESVIIARIVKGGAAEKSGLLHEGDEILEVNGVDMRGKNINDVSEMLANMSGTIRFMIIPSHHPAQENVQQSNKVMHLRALFTYDPEDDPYIPCRELGISFLRGDILHAIALDDPNWWQAFREGEEEDQSLAGLIPSKSFTEQRETIKMNLENKENKKKGRVCACGRKERKKRKKKKSLYNGSSEDCEEILTYEEIGKYYPQPNRKRPIVLIGPSNVGRNELQHRLLESDPDRFGTPTPHTTRPPRANEIDINAYHHIPKEEFNLMVQQNQFVEYGEHQKFQYGTSFDAIRDVIAQGKVCLLKQHPETLKLMRASDLKPYVIFVCPPNLDKLRQLQDQLSKALPFDEVEFRGRTSLSDDQLKEIIDRAREMEDLYGHLFDYVLVNSDLDRAFVELLDEINRIEVESQWVPTSWLETYSLQ
uniref:MAGUK p55 subfamily member 5 n=1 Tax=Biomphalaria glabrata TaxID=6526 RepID=A0A2C9JVM2_BIOGL